MKTKNVMREETTSGETTSYCSDIYIPFCFNRTTKNIDRENEWETQRDRNMCQVKRESTVISIGNLERLWKYLETHSLWDKSYSHRLLPISSFCQSDAWSKLSFWSRDCVASFSTRRDTFSVLFFRRGIYRRIKKRSASSSIFSFYSNFASFPVLFSVFVLDPRSFISREHEREHLFSITLHFQVQARYFAGFTGKGRDQKITWRMYENSRRAWRSCNWRRPKKGIVKSCDILSMQ